MDKPPLISVTIAVFNAEKYLDEAIDSILTQTFTDFDVVIIDDGSTDRSPQILQQYAQKDPRIQLVLREHRGIARTRNDLTELARGEFIAVMDGDDIALPDRFQRQVDFLRQHPDVVCVGSTHDFIDEVGRFLFRYEPPLDNSQIQEFALKGNTPINHPSAMIRRSALIQVGGYVETMNTAGILDLWLRLGEVGALANLKEPLLQYRQHQAAISESKQLLQIADRREACQRAWQRRGIEGTFEETKPWRPVDRASRYEFSLKYGWSFFQRREWEAAIVYGFRAIREMPLKAGGWKLVVYSVMKRLTLLVTP